MIPHITLQDLIDAFRQSFEVTDDAIMALRIIIATFFEQYVDGIPIWLYVVEPIGGCKSTIANIMDSVEKSLELNLITPKALRSNMKAENGKTIGQENLELINEKVWLFKDFTTVLSQNEFDRKAIYGVLRELYDGKISMMTGSIAGGTLTSCRSTIIASVTETIDRQGYNMQIMGERFAKIRLHLQAKRSEMIHKAMLECGNEEMRLKELRGKFESFYGYFKNPDFDPEMPEDKEDSWRWWQGKAIEVKENLLASPYAIKIEALADFITRTRIYCFKSQGADFIDDPLEEYGTRFVKVLTKMAILLTILSEKTEFGEEEWSILLKFAQDSCLPVRIEVLKQFMTEGFKELTTEYLSEKLKKSRRAFRYRLEELEAMHILKARCGDDNGFYVLGWKVNLEIIKLMAIIYGCEVPTEQQSIGSEQ